MDLSQFRQKSFIVLNILALRQDELILQKSSNLIARKSGLFN